MNKKGQPESRKNSEIKPVPNKNFKHFRIIEMVVILTIGLFIGWSMNYILLSKNVQGHSLINFNAEKHNARNNADKKDASHYEFINPYILTSVYDKIYHEELTSFKYLLEQYCLSAKKDKSIKQISVYFRDLTNGSWIGVNEKEKFIPASLSKVPVMIAVFLKAENDPMYMKKRLIFKGSFSASYLEAHPEIKDIRTSLKPYESYTVEQLVEYMITKSDNEAAMLLLTDVGIESWKALQKRLGYNTPIDATSATNIITVKNYSSFFRILYNASLLNREYSNKALEILSRSEYDKGIRQAVPSNIRISQKYGERDTLVSPTELKIQQLHQAGIVYYPGKPFFLCIMTKGSDKQKMENIILDISKIVYQQVDNQVKKFRKPMLLRDID